MSGGHPRDLPRRSEARDQPRCRAMQSSMMSSSSETPLSPPTTWLHNLIDTVVCESEMQVDRLSRLTADDVGHRLIDGVHGLCERLADHSSMTDSIDRCDLRHMPTVKAKVERVQLLNRFAEDRTKASLYGTLYITASHLIFVGDGAVNEIWVLHNLIGTVDRGSITASGCLLYIKCKHFLNLTLIIARDKECQAVFDSLTTLSQPVNIEQVHAFTYAPSASKSVGNGAACNAKDAAQCANSDDRSAGWAWDLRDEYIAMGIDGENDKWKLTDLNVAYAYCETYPEHLVVPSISSKAVLIASSRFRSRGRLPVLTYYHKRNGATICRCAQPLSGFSARCEEDEQLVADMVASNANCAVLYLVDTRPRINTLANKAQGKGTENEKFYANLRSHSFNIENIHVMRTSLGKLIEVLSRPTNASSFMSAVDATGWLRHIRVILECARFVAEAVDKGITCVVHCSDGWDRTAQTCALAQILLNARYRTIDGFRALIEKDWLHFGHKFTDRCGQAGVRQSVGEGSTAEAKEMSPVFTQFLDAVWQLQRQFPRIFEFNARYLIDLHDQVYACQFGTFLGNCDQDRKDLRLSTRTYSVWPHLARGRGAHLNVLYSAQLNEGRVLHPDVRIHGIGVWHDMYTRWERGVAVHGELCNAIDAAHVHNCVMKEHMAMLRSTVAPSKSTNSASSMQDSGVGSASISTVECADSAHPLLITNCTTDPLAELTIDDADVGGDVAVKWAALHINGVASPSCASCQTAIVQGSTIPNCVRCGCLTCDRCSCGMSVLEEGLRRRFVDDPDSSTKVHIDGARLCYKCRVTMSSS